MTTDQIYDFTVVFQPANEGGYSVFVPALPGCFTQGETLSEAKKMAEEAISVYLEALTEDGEKIPEDSGELVGRVRVKPDLA